MKRPISSSRQRIPLLPRERAALIILRQKGHSINNLAAFMGRSTSVVHRILSRELSRHWRLRKLRFFDLRKLPAQMKKRIAAAAWRKLMLLRARWLQFITSEEGEPP